MNLIVNYYSILVTKTIYLHASKIDYLRSNSIDYKPNNDAAALLSTISLF
jgi:hypothetical protein